MIGVAEFFHYLMNTLNINLKNIDENASYNIMLDDFLTNHVTHEDKHEIVDVYGITEAFKLLKENGTDKKTLQRHFHYETRKKMYINYVYATVAHAVLVEQGANNYTIICDYIKANTTDE